MSVSTGGLGILSYLLLVIPFYMLNYVPETPLTSSLLENPGNLRSLTNGLESHPPRKAILPRASPQTPDPSKCKPKATAARFRFDTPTSSAPSSLFATPLPPRNKRHGS